MDRAYHVQGKRAAGRVTRAAGRVTKQLSNNPTGSHSSHPKTVPESSRKVSEGARKARPGEGAEQCSKDYTWCSSGVTVQQV